MPILSRNVDKKSILTLFSIAICHPTGDKCQSKTLFLSIFYLRSSIVDNVFDYRLPGVNTRFKMCLFNNGICQMLYCTGSSLEVKEDALTDIDNPYFRSLFNSI